MGITKLYQTHISITELNQYLSSVWLTICRNTTNFPIVNMWFQTLVVYLHVWLLWSHGILNVEWCMFLYTKYICSYNSTCTSQGVLIMTKRYLIPFLFSLGVSVCPVSSSDHFDVDISTCLLIPSITQVTGMAISLYLGCGLRWLLH